MGKHPGRAICPISSGLCILPMQMVTITAKPAFFRQPQSFQSFQISYFVISGAGTAGGAADWVVNDIKIGNRSQLRRSGDVPGALFMNNDADEDADEVNNFVRFTSSVAPGDNVAITVTYIGSNESGCPLFGTLVGMVIDGPFDAPFDTALTGRPSMESEELKSGNLVQLQRFVDAQHERPTMPLSLEQRAEASAAWSSALRAMIFEQRERDAEAGRYTPWWSPEEQRGDDL